ncbi:CBS domain containing protein [Acanthamoeba castellanii str. Neff]|uniref:CBS domain containing protein n=1 Tax=Acanthamoeba castellanii (strain ATCC 30010 / Neff) TaxID=1257118 RepID=L8H8C1_ACACF|nr:CBS domain containing protein [Acanthamoeba castellanii str. Neff]ELR20973.1 CBS domain containing protein [Acanthamoeba castellanii str. Neff]
MSEGHKPEKVVDEREAESEEGEEEVEVKSTDSEEDVWVKRLREQLADFQPLTPPGSPLATAKVGLRLRALIARTTVRDVVSFHARLIVLEAHDSVDHCLMTLQDNGITAVPILDLENRKYLGMVSALDLAAYVASLFPATEALPEQLPNIELKSIVNFSKMSPFLPQSLDTSLPALMQIFSSGVHRLPLQDDKGNVCGLVSQTDVLRFFVAHLNELLGTDLRGSNSLPTIDALGLTKSKRQIEKISTEDSVSQVIDHLYKVSALALVDADGKLVGDLSADSLRTLSDYLQFGPNALFDEVIGSILDAGKHRAWVVDAEGRPQAMITLTDIIRKLLAL